MMLKSVEIRNGKAQDEKKTVKSESLLLEPMTTATLLPVLAHSSPVVRAQEPLPRQRERLVWSRVAGGAAVLGAAAAAG
jgi:hypothetical protein